MSIKKIFARNLSILFIDKFIRALYTIILGAYIARYFGPEKFGFISILITMPAIFASFSNFGADKIVVKELSIRPNLEFKLFGTIYYSRLYACFIFFAFLIFYYFMIEKYNAINLLISALISSSLLFNFADTFDLYFQSKMLNHKTILSKMIVLVTVSIIRIIMLLERCRSG